MKEPLVKPKHNHDELVFNDTTFAIIILLIVNVQFITIYCPQRDAYSEISVDDYRCDVMTARHKYE